MIIRVLGEYREPAALLNAVRSLRSKGYQRLEVYTPYPVHGVDEALGLRRSRLPVFVFVIGMSAAAGAYLLQWYLNAYLYPINVGNRPPHFPVAYVPITFEMGVLFSALSAFIAVLALGRLLRPWDVVFEVEHFESASNDAYWIEVSAGDKRFDPVGTAADLRETGASRVSMLENES